MIILAHDNSCYLINHPGKMCVSQTMLNGPCITTVYQPVYGKTYNMACVRPETNRFSLGICKFLLKSLMYALWVANDTTVKWTAKTGQFSHLCSLGFAAFWLRWIGIVLTRVGLTRDPFSNAIFTVELGSFQEQMSH